MDAFAHQYTTSTGKRIVGKHGLDDCTVTFVGSSCDAALGDQWTRRGVDHPHRPPGRAAISGPRKGQRAVPCPSPRPSSPAADPGAGGDDAWSPFWVQTLAHSW
jgi:hypothetical protein